MKNRVDQKLSEHFKKDNTYENIMSILNNCLEAAQRSLILDNGDKYPTLHILGVPRSGTTLVSQIISSYLPVGYINNLIAAFWKAPIFGIELSKKLITGRYISDFKSTFGRTSSIVEPHEFGYFWNYHLQYSELYQQSSDHEGQINWEELSSILNNITYCFGAPVIFKSFLFGFHAQTAVQKMPKTCFIYVKRNFLDNAFSILKLRKQLNGDIKEWGSIKPKQYNKLKNLSVHEQIAGQILCLEHEYLSQLEAIPTKNKAFFRYESICKHPEEFLLAVKNLLSFHYSLPEHNIVDLPVFNTLQPEDRDDKNRELFIKAAEKIRKIFPGIKSLK